MFLMLMRKLNTVRHLFIYIKLILPNLFVRNVLSKKI
jgi:hypothetical protein